MRRISRNQRYSSVLERKRFGVALASFRDMSTGLRTPFGADFDDPSRGRSYRESRTVMRSKLEVSNACPAQKAQLPYRSQRGIAPFTLCRAAVQGGAAGVDGGG
jgi:hypothetical protein